VYKQLEVVDLGLSKNYAENDFDPKGRAHNNSSGLEDGKDLVLEGVRDLDGESEGDESSALPVIRPRNFDMKVVGKDRNFRILANENLRVNGIKDAKIRNLMIRDQLLIFMDKISQLRKRLNLRQGSVKLLNSTKMVDAVRINKQIELVIVLCDSLCKRLIRELYDKLEQLGLTHSPYLHADKSQVKIEDESVTFERNHDLFVKMVEYTGNCVTIFFYICKNDLLQQLSLRETNFIIKTIQKLRFFIGLLLEDLRLKEIDYSTEVI
jgi:hypothetical protein